MKYIIAFVLLASITLFSYAQPKIVFNEKTYDYGSIKEDGGLAVCVFEFTNSGTEPLILNNVKASCGCTSPNWTKAPVAPNQKGTIKVSYNPKNRPGSFSKNVNVYSNTQPSVTVLNIKGKVAPREKTLEEKYPRVMGPLRLKSNYLSLGSIFSEESKEGELIFVNTSDSPVKMGIHRAPAHIQVRFEPEFVDTGAQGKAIITYDAKLKNAYGYSSDRIYLTINDEKNNTYSIGTSVTIKEDFSNLSEEDLAKAPVAQVDKKVFDFGTIVQGAKVGHSFMLSNDGKKDLLIRNVKTTCGCTAVKHENLVKPGESIDLRVEFNSRGKRSRQNKSITVTTNDPKNPTLVLRIMGTFEGPAKK
jgi:hypothetical protein